MEGRSFLCAIYSFPNNPFREKDFLRRTILSFLKEGFPIPEKKEQYMIQKHLDKHYCSICGEYIYSHFPQRENFHHHHAYYPRKFESTFMKRVKIFPKLNVVVLERLNPNVGLLPKKNMNYISIRSKKLVSLRIWSIDEWNAIYPVAFIHIDQNYSRFIHKPSLLKKNPFFIPLYSN